MYCACFLLISGCGGGDPPEDDADVDAGDADIEDDADALQPVEPPTFEVIYEPTSLTDDARDAIALAPGWLRDDLAITLSRLGRGTQDELSALLLDLEEDRILDELAFTIAHTSPEVLEHFSFHSELLLINAQLLYEHDDDLDYVEIVDVGEPGVDSDYYSTLSYRVEAEDGTIVEHQIEPEMYYWYVVHPRLEDEYPFFVDGWSSGSPTVPENGWFWREFLWDAAAEECPEERECPLLMEFLRDVEVFQRRTEDSAFESSGAEQVWAFIDSVMTWGAGDERPVQPVRIYVVACGNCGEYADIRVAAARTALIPARNCGASSNDHTWVEWWIENVGWQGELDFYRGGVRRDGRDNDCDGVADDALDDSDADGDGVSIADGDCDDSDAEIHPGAEERHNGRDDDCDGIADPDFVDAELDGDGDGFSIATGDCREANADVHPDAEEVENGIDDDCDGVADDGLDTADADEDGYSIADGDCDDTTAEINPDAEELANGLDDNCDGVADEGFDAFDRDGDGWTLASGDCDELHSDAHPDGQDPFFSSNRLYAITTTRGDTLLGIDRTDAYATGTSFLEFDVIDDDGDPIDGALVTIYGTWEVYGEPDLWGLASEVLTDQNGHAAITVGEYNPYGYSVVSAIGANPEPGYLRQLVERSTPNETYSATVRIPGQMPTAVDVTEEDLTGDEPRALTLSLEIEVESHRVIGDGRLNGSFMVENEGGVVDAYLVDDENYDRFRDGEPFDAQHIELDTSSNAADVELPGNQRWTLVIANSAFVTSTLVGSVALSVEPADGVIWSSTPEPFISRFQLAPTEHMAIAVVP